MLVKVRRTRRFPTHIKREREMSDWPHRLGAVVLALALDMGSRPARWPLLLRYPVIVARIVRCSLNRYRYQVAVRFGRRRLVVLSHGYRLWANVVHDMTRRHAVSHGVGRDRGGGGRNDDGTALPRPRLHRRPDWVMLVTNYGYSRWRHAGVWSHGRGLVVH